MGKKWDSNKGGRDQWIEWLTTVMKECLRVIKPGGMILVWSIPRTSHWTATAIENAGFEIREKFYHLFGSGFPKSTNISKQLDKKLGVERENDFKSTTIRETANSASHRGTHVCDNCGKYYGSATANCHCPKSTPVSDQAKLFDGYGTATKPAVEEWILAMAPLDGTFAENALKWGVAGINIDAGRIKTDIQNDPNYRKNPTKSKGLNSIFGIGNVIYGRGCKPQGRWPSNLILQHHPDCVKIGVKKVKSVKQIKSKINPYESDRTWSTSKTEDNGKNRWFGDEEGNETIEEYQCHPECPVHLLNQQAGVKKSGTNCTRTKEGFFLEHGGMGKAGDKQITYGDEGYVSRYFLNLPPDTNRFFYSAKASRSERSKGCENLYWKQNPQILISKEEWDKLPESERSFGNIHSTVKPLGLIKYLCGLLQMPQNTLILDLFAGSGTLGVACEQLKIPYILIEKEPEYCDIIRTRVNAANQPDKPTKRKPIVKPTNTLFAWNEINIETE